MIAQSSLPQNFIEWNRRHSAPYGPIWWRGRLRHHLWNQRSKLPPWVIRQVGPFGFQRNSQTRRFEYPWCYYATPLSAGMKVIDIGAGASGFQFVLGSEGVHVTSVDPYVETEGSEFQFTLHDIECLRSAFRVPVEFVLDYLENANLPAESYDRIYSVSVLEHVPPEGIPPIMAEARRLLKPGGYLVATIDLFLDCWPFTDKVTNSFGSNVSVKALVDASGLRLVKGDPRYLHGFPEFVAKDVLNKRDEFLVYNDVMAQCIVLQKD